jgi:formate/nitrite transporter FocA (FNT family)
MAEAGSDSPHLEKAEQAQAAEHSAPQALVIHEVVRDEGEHELEKRSGAVAWSGLAAGMSMGFSFLCLAVISSMLPDSPWRPLVASAGYTVGFVITILSRQELYSESTLTVMLPLLVRRDLATLLGVLRFWGIVLVANLAGTWLFALLLTKEALFATPIQDALRTIGHESIGGDFGVTLMKAVIAGWLIALMAWMLPSARSARLFVILLLTYVVALCHLPHIVAGSVEAAFSWFTGQASALDYLYGFLLPTLIGNTIGGVALVALLNHAPLAEDLSAESPPPRRPHRRVSKKLPA